MGTAIDLERLFKAGVTAYQSGEYEKAIAVFLRLSRTKSSTYRAKAKMGLVRAYVRQKDWNRARALCEQLKDSAEPALHQWAIKMLTKIDRQSEAQLNVLSSARSRSNASSSTQNGLVASSITNSQTTSQTDNGRSGFQLIKADAKYTASAKAEIPSCKQEKTEQSFSMFHYDYLNGEESRNDEGESNHVVIELDTENEDKKKAGLNSPASPTVAQESTVSSSTTEQLGWIYAGRLNQGKPLGHIKRGPLRLAQMSGAIAFYWVWRWLIHQLVGAANGFLGFLDSILPFWVRSLPSAWRDVTWPLLIFFFALTAASPWLWDLWLKLSEKAKPCSSSHLRIQSAESATLISRYCRQQRWQLPTLWKLPTATPLIFSYGWLPRNARIVFSQGLLTQLQSEEIAALVAYEMSHWRSWSWPLLSVKGLVWQVLLWLYWHLSLWGNRQVKWLAYPSGVVATLLYGVFWLSRIPALWMARVRTYYGDRTASTLTGNPNGLTRALAKLSFQLTESIEKQGYTPLAVEGLAPLLPASTDLARAPLYGQIPLSQLFAWDYLNPLRSWMSCLETHPPLGDRIRLLMAYAQHWKLVPEICFLPDPTERKRKKKGQRLSRLDWGRLFQQAAPYIGTALGLVVGSVALGVGAIAFELDWPALDWMHRDIDLLKCCLLLGFATGTILRMNQFFPDLSFSTAPHIHTPNWIDDPTLLPVDSLPVKLAGNLVGRPGIANWLGQDLLIRTPAGLMKLHYFSMLGPLGNAFGLSRRPISAIDGESVQLLGWLRRGHQPWIDIDEIRLSNGSLIQGGHPIFSLLLAASACLTGLWLLIRNSPYG